jgi:two-component system response regulator HydG
MLGKPVSRFLSPNPVESLSGRPHDFAALRREKWKNHAKLDYSKKAGKLLPLLPPLDTTLSDFRLECRFRLEAGALPSVIVNGSRDHKQYFPDFNGYLLGPAPPGKAFQIKKEGRIVHQVPFDTKGPAGNHTIEVIKRGACLAYFLDGELVIGYRDPVLFTSAESHQYLFRRPGTRMRIDTVRLSTLPAARNLHQGFNEVAQVRGGESAFQYHALADDALRRGNDLYYGFVLYDVTFLKKNIALLQKAQAGLARERDKYKNLALGKDLPEEPFVGESPLLLKLKSEAKRAARAPVTVLIEGDTGTGKEILARYIHAQSPRKDGPFVKVDCSTLPDTLIESELFGVEKGAFTGAVEARPGKLEIAHGGTIFLDELGNLDLKTQAKLLNFLQAFTLERLGSTRKIKVDARIVAATNRPLKGMIEKGLFRADLYFRISTVKFGVPPLADRREDIRPLCGHFLKVYNEKFDRQIKGFAPTALQKLLAHAWPGNVRELENTVQKAVLFCEADVIGEDRIEISGEWTENRADTSQVSIPRGSPRALTREHVEELLKRNNGIVEWAARDARVSRNTLFRKIKKFGITAER